MRKLSDEQIEEAKKCAIKATQTEYIDEYLESFCDRYRDPRSSTGRTKYGDLVFKLFIERLKNE